MLNSLNLTSEEQGKHNVEKQCFTVGFGRGSKIIEEGLSILFSFIPLGNLNRRNVVPCVEGCSSLYCSYDESLPLSWLFNLILFSN